MASDQNGRDVRSTESSRVEAFSDGVFAIALTLLVLDLRAPDNEQGGFAHALLDQWPSYLAYLAAFLNISAIWINHHDLFTRVHRVDIRLICANLVLLLVASLFPWPAAVISAAVRTGTHDDEIAATVLYAGIGFLVPLAWILVYRYLSHRPHLLTEPAEVAYTRAGVRRSLLSVIVYPAAGALAFIDPIIALVSFVVLPIFFIATLLYPTTQPRQHTAQPTPPTG